MTGVVAESVSDGPTVRDAQFRSYTVRCSCGWRFGTTDRAQTRAVRSLGEAHSEVCLG